MLMRMGDAGGDHRDSGDGLGLRVEADNRVGLDQPLGLNIGVTELLNVGDSPLSRDECRRFRQRNFINPLLYGGSNTL